ncbi:MAG: phage tail protein [Pseudacidovorax sp.]|uniref:phage tail protein n=1 Tax=Pseudacidovorax sp. TaxID=1934311 RepID=UPI001B3E61BC|nr:phage tail protein [Pseudacidovorax sp.]MBP6894318.1 phage tail protein [Pseudacidovorax sp.]
MLCLGLFVFQLDTLSYQELQRRTSWKHASQPLVGARNASQYLGPGEDTITLQGLLIPEFTGEAASLDMLRAMADTGAAWVLIEGTGTLYGAFVIKEMTETRTLFYEDGTARRIEFSLTLERVDQDVQDVVDQLGELGALMQSADGGTGLSLNITARAALG